MTCPRSHSKQGPEMGVRPGASTSQSRRIRALAGRQAPCAARSLQCRLRVSRPLDPSDNGRLTQVEPTTSGDALPESPQLAGTAGENQRHRGGATGEWLGSHTPAAERGPTEKGGSWPARPANSLRSVVPACRGSSEDVRRRHREGRKTGRGRGGGCACAPGGSASELPARPADTRAAPPRKSGVFRAALCRGGGEAEERGLREPLELRFPVEGWGGWFVEAALTATAAAAASAAAAAAWRRPIHPPAAGRLTAWEGPRAWAARLLRVVARASSSSTNPLPSPPPPPSSSTSSGQPTARPLLKPGSSVAMTPGKHSQAADAGGWGPGTAEPLGKGRRALVCGSPPCSALRRPPASRPALPRKFRTRSVVHSSRSRRQPLGLERGSQLIRSRGAPRRLRLLCPRSVFIEAPLRCSAPASFASKCFCL